MAIFVHSFQLLFRECNFPKGFVLWIGAHAVLFWFLFSDFYTKTYNKQSRTKALQFSINGYKNGLTNGKVNGTSILGEKDEKSGENDLEVNNNVMNGKKDK